MQLTTFTETMRGRVSPADSDTAPSSSRPWILAAHTAASHASNAQPLILENLHLALLSPDTPQDGFHGDVLSGVISGPGFSAPLHSGTAHILVDHGGRRVMRYVLLAKTPEGTRVRIIGTKYLRGGPLRAWRDTTTLYVDVYQSVGDWEVLIMTGVARVHIRDLWAQLLSLRGRPLHFVAGFLRRLF